MSLFTYLSLEFGCVPIREVSSFLKDNTAPVVTLTS